jgi:hypothetical protein
MQAGLKARIAFVLLDVREVTAFDDDLIASLSGVWNAIWKEAHFAAAA